MMKDDWVQRIEGSPFHQTKWVQWFESIERLTVPVLIFKQEKLIFMNHEAMKDPQVEHMLVPSFPMRLKGIPIYQWGENLVLVFVNSLKSSSSGNHLEVFSNLSHELRTPMNAVIGFSKLLKKTPLDTTQQDYVDKINIASDHLLELINDVIDFTRIQTGKIQLEIKPFRITKLMDDIKAMFIDAAHQKGLYLDFQHHDLPSVVLGDQSRIRQIMMNLVSNAIKFTESGGVTLLSKGLRTLESGHVEIEFSIKDTGIGMSDEHMDHIFDSFNQGSSSSYRRFGGSGLGLSISKQLANLMHGDIHVSSLWNEGSEFKFVVPLEVSQESATLRQNDINLMNDSIKVGAKILVADENNISLRLIERILTNMGMEVTLVQDGNEALKLALSQPFDLMILGLKLPNKNGIDIARDVRTHQIHVPILALTAHAFSEDRQACLHAGMNDYIQKPIDQLSLYQAISVWLKEK